jgi:hypothetical protein
MKAKYIKRREVFESEAEALLQRRHAVKGPPGDVWPVYLLATAAGELRLSIHTDLCLCEQPWFAGGGWPWVAGRFEDVTTTGTTGRTTLGRAWNCLSGQRERRGRLLGSAQSGAIDQGNR